MTCHTAWEHPIPPHISPPPSPPPTSDVIDSPVDGAAAAAPMRGIARGAGRVRAAAAAGAPPTPARKRRRRAAPEPEPEPEPAPPVGPRGAYACVREPGAVEAALDHLLAADPRLGPLVDAHGYAAPKHAPCCFTALARTIVFQQLNGKAAATIFGRFCDAVGADAAAPYPPGAGAGACTDTWAPADVRVLSPERVLATPEPELRACGLSARKAEYVQSLAGAFAGDDATLSDARLRSMDDAELAAELTALRGLGPWSVHMFMIFTLGRADVLPTGDLGVRKGMMRHYGLKALPSPSQMVVRVLCASSACARSLSPARPPLTPPPIRFPSKGARRAMGAVQERGESLHVAQVRVSGGLKSGRGSALDAWRRRRRCTRTVL